MSERKTAAEWSGLGWKYVVEHWPEMLADLAAMEALAIGGEGETHFYYRDECARLREELADYVAYYEAVKAFWQPDYDEADETWNAVQRIEARRAERGKA